MRNIFFIKHIVLLGILLGLSACAHSGPSPELVQDMGAAPNAPAGVQMQRVSENNACYSLQIDYPVTGESAIDRKIRDWVNLSYDSATAEFNAFCTNVTPKQPFKLWVEYDLFMTPRTVGVVFKSLIYAGGDQYHDRVDAHNYLRESGEDLDYKDIFISNEGVAGALSTYAIGSFTPALGDIWKENPEYAGALEPAKADFSNFAIIETGLLLYFPTRQIAPFFAGPQECAVPLGELGKFGPRPEIWQ